MPEETSDADLLLDSLWMHPRSLQQLYERLNLFGLQFTRYLDGLRKKVYNYMLENGLKSPTGNKTPIVRSDPDDVVPGSDTVIYVLEAA